MLCDLHSKGADCLERNSNVELSLTSAGTNQPITTKYIHIYHIVLYVFSVMFEKQHHGHSLTFAAFSSPSSFFFSFCLHCSATTRQASLHNAKCRDARYVLFSADSNNTTDN